MLPQSSGQPRPTSRLCRAGSFGRVHSVVHRATFRDRCGEGGLFRLLHGRGLCPWSRGSNSSPRRAPLPLATCRNWCESRQVAAPVLRLCYYDGVSTSTHQVQSKPYCGSADCGRVCGQVGDVVWEPCKPGVHGGQQTRESRSPDR